MSDKLNGPDESQLTNLLAALQKQKTFTHDICTPVSVAQGMLDLALIKLKENPGVDPAAIAKLEKSMKALERLSTLIQENREFLHKAA